MNSAVAASSAGFVGRPASRRVIPRNARLMGIAEGNIIATIMTTSRAKNRRRSVEPIVNRAIWVMRESVDVHVAYHAAATTSATAIATGIVTRFQSAAGSARVAVRIAAVTTEASSTYGSRRSGAHPKTVK